MKRLVFVLALALSVGCSDVKNTPRGVVGINRVTVTVKPLSDEEAVKYTKEVMDKYADGAKNGKDNITYDYWGTPIHLQYSMDESAEVTDDSYAIRFIKGMGILPKEVRDIRVRGGGWVSFKLDGQDRLERLELPNFRKNKVRKMYIRSAGPDKKMNTEDDLHLHVECNFTQVIGNITEGGKSVGHIIYVEK